MSHSPTSPDRLYAPIWNELKTLPRKVAESKGVSITAHRALHNRILKAVKKEKWLDVGYKLECGMWRATLWHTRKNSTLTFYLSFNFAPSLLRSLSTKDF